MRKNIVVLAVIASLGVAGLAMNAGADTARGGPGELGQRVTELENRADHQRRAIDSLRSEVAKQQRKITKLMAFRTATNRWIARIDQRTSKLRNRGVYTGPVDNGQVQLGGDPAECTGQIAKWNASGGALGCETPAP
ncbi:MAG: hypothetical protein ACRDHI_09090 [Actinomycetota bacterium]